MQPASHPRSRHVCKEPSLDPPQHPKHGRSVICIVPWESSEPGLLLPPGRQPPAPCPGALWQLPAFPEADGQGLPQRGCVASVLRFPWQTRAPHVSHYSWGYFLPGVSMAGQAGAFLSSRPSTLLRHQGAPDEAPLEVEKLGPRAFVSFKVVLF